MYRETCEGSERGEQSAEVLDLRMTCLQERLGGLRALTDVFKEANGEVVENAVSAVNNLGSLDRCADVPLLRSVVRPAEDSATRARVEALRHRLAAVKALFDAGRYREGLKDAPRLVEEARALDYQPVLAEALALMGTMHHKENDSRTAERLLTDSYLAADASRHDEVRAEDAAALVWVVGYQQGRYADAQQWAKHAEAILRRLGGHELQRAWLLNNLGAIYMLEGELVLCENDGGQSQHGDAANESTHDRVPSLVVRRGDRRPAPKRSTASCGAEFPPFALRGW